MYPNPADVSLDVSLGQTVVSRATLKNILGQQVWRGIVANTEFGIPVGHLPKGHYFLQLENRNGARTVK